MTASCQDSAGDPHASWPDNSRRPGAVSGVLVAWPLAMVRLAYRVVEPRTVMCVGRNYRSHAEEFGNPVPDEPLLFLKPPAAVTGPGEEVVHPRLSRRVDPEAELVLVIGKRARSVAAADAWDVIGGYTCGNDITARTSRSPTASGRGERLRHLLPGGALGGDRVRPGRRGVSCTVDGERRQDGRAKDLIFPIPFVIEYITAFTTLEPGDIILSGTPEGVRPVQPGNTVTVEVEGLGTLTNPIVGEAADR